MLNKAALGSASKENKETGASPDLSVPAPEVVVSHTFGYPTISDICDTNKTDKPVFPTEEELKLEEEQRNLETKMSQIHCPPGYRSLRDEIISAREKAEADKKTVDYINMIPKAPLGHSAEPVQRSVSDMINDINFSRSNSLMRTPAMSSLPRGNTSQPRSGSTTDGFRHTPAITVGQAYMTSGARYSGEAFYPGVSYITPSPGSHLPAVTPKMPSGGELVTCHPT